jgi:N-acyl homoserine lactone hydrolase
MPLTEDGSISIIPTPGHANGHQSVLIADEGISVCIIGDAAFSLTQIQSGEIGGIVENHADAVRSAWMLRNQYESYGTIMLPTHDLDNAARLIEV